MTNERIPADPGAILDPEDVNSSPATEPRAAKPSVPSDSDRSDEVPVPIAMSAAEIDERAQAVEAMRHVPRQGPADVGGREA